MTKRYKIQVEILGKDKASGAFNKLKNTLGGLPGPLGKVTGALGRVAEIALGTMLAGGIQKIASSLTGLAKESVFAAARLQELTLVSQMMGERAGLSSDEVQAAATSIQALGIQADVAQKLVAQFIRYELDLGDAVKLARVAQDAAVLSMQDSSQALDGLLHGVLTYNSRVLRTYGINTQAQKAFKQFGKEVGTVTTKLADNSKAIAKMEQNIGFLEREVANAEQAFHRENAELIHARDYWEEGSNELLRFQERVEKAHLALDKKTARLIEQRTSLAALRDEHGKSIPISKAWTDEMTESQKVQAMLNAVIKEGARIQGVYETAMEAPGKQWRSFKRYVYDLKVALGEPLLGAFGGAISIAKEFVKSLTVAAEEGGWLRESIEQLGAAVEVLLSVLAGKTPWENILPASLSASIHEIIDLLDGIQSQWDEMWPQMTGAWNDFRTGFEPSWSQMLDDFALFKDEIQPALIDAWQGLKDLWDEVAKSLGLADIEADEFFQTLGEFVGSGTAQFFRDFLDAVVIGIHDFKDATEWARAGIEGWQKAIANFNIAAEHMPWDEILSLSTIISAIELPKWLRPGSATPFEEALVGIAGVVQEEMKPAFDEFMAMLMEKWMALTAYLLEESWPLMQDTWTILVTTMQDLWLTAMNLMAVKFAELLAAVLAGIQQMIAKWEGLKLKLDEVAAAVQKVTDKIKALTSASMLARLQRLISKFEGLAEAARDAASAMSAVGAGDGGGGATAFPTGVSPAFRGAGGGTAGGIGNTYYQNLHIHTSAPYEPIVADFELMKAMAA